MQTATMEKRQVSGNASTEKNVPEKRITTGAISATIWHNEAKLRNGQIGEFRTVTLQRRYMDKNNQWQTSNSLRVNDLPKAALVLSKAYEYLVLKEQDSKFDSQQAVEEEDVEEEIVI